MRRRLGYIKSLVGAVRSLDGAAQKSLLVIESDATYLAVSRANAALRATDGDPRALAAKVLQARS